MESIQTTYICRYGIHIKSNNYSSTHTFDRVSGSTSHIALVAMVGIWMCLTAQFSFLTRQWGLMLVDWFSCPVVACKDGEGSVFQKCSQCLQVVCLCQLWDTFPIVLGTLFNMVTAGV